MSLCVAFNTLYQTKTLSKSLRLRSSMYLPTASDLGLKRNYHSSGKRDDVFIYDKALFVGF